MKRTGITHTIQTYGIRSVFFKYIFSTLFIVVIVFVPFYLFVNQYHNFIMTEEVAKLATLNTLQSKNVFDSMTEVFHKYYELASRSTAVQSFIETEWSFSEGAGGQVRDAQNFLWMLSNSSEIIEDAYLYGFENDVVLTSSSWSLVGQDNPYGWLRTYRSVKLPFLIFPRKDNSTEYNCYYICSEIYDGTVPVALFCLKMDYQTFSEIVEESFVEPPDQTFIVSDTGLILYSSNKDFINKTMFEREDTYLAFYSAQAVDNNYIKYEDYIISIAKSTKSKLLIMSYTPMDKISENYNFRYVILLGGVGVILIVSLLLAIWFAYRHYRSVAGVVAVLENPSAFQKTPKRSGEFHYIVDTISDISYQHKEIADELEEKAHQLQSSQIAALQAQINPHFLFNTLQLINLGILSETKQDTTYTVLISKLSSMVRTAYDTNRYIISVAQELEITRNYLDIQKSRYHSSLHVDYFFDEQCLKYDTIKLLLQPLVENAVLHGFAGRQPPWVITVRCRIVGEGLAYEISDNGKGIEWQDLRAIKQQLNCEPVMHSSQVGLFNVYQRLKLIYGEQGHMDIDSQGLEEGTTITIWHPLTVTSPLVDALDESEMRR